MADMPRPAAPATTPEQQAADEPAPFYCCGDADNDND